MSFNPSDFEVAIKSLCPAIHVHACDAEYLNAELRGVGSINARMRYSGEWAVTMGTVGTTIDAADAMTFATGMMQLAAAVTMLKGAIMQASK